jgi:UDP-2,3-diacylglucosamine pyrophosphatase LpxH
MRRGQAGSRSSDWSDDMHTRKRPGVRVRTAFLSDIHLGARECRADLVLQFLHTVHMDELFLVGDIVDVWSLRRSFYWPQLHNNVLRTILGKAKHGTRVVYVPGNHDEELREMSTMVFGNLEVHREYVHTTAAGKQMLVVHGDEFDGNVQCSRWLNALGSHAYDLTLGLNRGFNRVRRTFGYPYWSLATYLKSRVGNAMRYVERFEDAAAHAAARRGLDGVICGHIHRPMQSELRGVRYCNTGDWVENCTALIEDRAGALQLWQPADWLVSEAAHEAQLRAA